MSGMLTAGDRAALEAMEKAFYAAVAYNDSLAVYSDTTGITNDALCYYFDDRFHRYDSVFEANHRQYSHNNPGDGHRSGDWMMGTG